MDAPIYFEDGAGFRAWLKANHRTAEVLWVGFHRKATGRPTMTWSESVDEALCYGWIDGLRQRVDETRYKIRFTPRRRGSHWSKVNLEKVAVLERQRRMRKAGRDAFAERVVDGSDPYAYEAALETLAPKMQADFRKKKKAWAFFEAKPPGYRRLCVHWVMSAKREATRSRRFDTLVQCSAEGLEIPPLRRKP